MADPEKRERRNAQARERHANPQYRRLRNDRAREGRRRLSADPEWRKRKNAIVREYLRKRRATDPGWLERHKARQREGEREKRTTDPEWVERRKARDRERLQTPKGRALNVRAAHRYRSRKAGAAEHEFAEKYDPRDIFERDGWLCQLCPPGTPHHVRRIPKTLKAPHPRSATIDHIIPLSVEGAWDGPGNVQAAHWSCNSAKQARPIGKPALF